MREEEERARDEKRRLKAIADRECAAADRERANDMKTQTSGRVMRERKQVNYDERAFDRKLAEAIEERPTRHASDRAARFERHDYEGSHDIRTRKPVNYDEDALDRELDEATEEGTTEEGTTPRVRDPNATEDASEESDGAGGEERGEDGGPHHAKVPGAVRQGK